VLAPLASPIAGFLVRNLKGETIFGSNTTRENYPLPEMLPDEDAMLSEACNVKPNSRLGCQIPVTQELEGLVVELAPEY
jgi:hypothetical protein